MRSSTSIRPAGNVLILYHVGDSWYPFEQNQNQLTTDQETIWFQYKFREWMKIQYMEYEQKRRGNKGEFWIKYGGDEINLITLKDKDDTKV